MSESKSGSFEEAAKGAVEELLQNSSWENREVNFVQTEASAYYEGANDGIKWALEYLAKGGEELKFTTDAIHDNVTEKWSLHWFDPGINEEDTANYRRRILSVDANMRHSISRMFAEYAAPLVARNVLLEQMLIAGNEIIEKYRASVSDAIPKMDSQTDLVAHLQAANTQLTAALEEALNVMCEIYCMGDNDHGRLVVYMKSKLQTEIEKIKGSR